MAVGKNKSTTTDAAVQRRVQLDAVIGRVPLHHIAPVAAMVVDFKCNMQNTNKTQLLASNYGTF